MDADESFDVIIEVGHKASLKEKVDSNGNTHKWNAFVRSGDHTNQQKLDLIVKKVVFNLHETFKNPTRPCFTQPYCVKESGYGQFEFPIDIYFNGTDTKYSINYYLELPSLNCTQPLSRVRKEKITFINPCPEFRKVLIEGGSIMHKSDNLNHNTSSSHILNNSSNNEISTSKIDQSDSLPKLSIINTNTTNNNNLSSSSSSSLSSSPPMNTASSSFDKKLNGKTKSSSILTSNQTNQNKISNNSSQTNNNNKQLNSTSSSTTTSTTNNHMINKSSSNKLKNQSRSKGKSTVIQQSQQVSPPGVMARSMSASPSPKIETAKSSSPNNEARIKLSPSLKIYSQQLVTPITHSHMAASFSPSSNNTSYFPNESSLSEAVDSALNKNMNNTTTDGSFLEVENEIEIKTEVELMSVEVGGSGGRDSSFRQNNKKRPLISSDSDSSKSSNSLTGMIQNLNGSVSRMPVFTPTSTNSNVNSLYQEDENTAKKRRFKSQVDTNNENNGKICDNSDFKKLTSKHKENERSSPMLKQDKLLNSSSNDTDKLKPKQLNGNSDSTKLNSLGISNKIKRIKRIKSEHEMNNGSANGAVDHRSRSSSSEITSNDDNSLTGDLAEFNKRSNNKHKNPKKNTCDSNVASPFNNIDNDQIISNPKLKSLTAYSKSPSQSPSSNTTNEEILNRLTERIDADNKSKRFNNNSSVNSSNTNVKLKKTTTPSPAPPSSNPSSNNLTSSEKIKKSSNPDKTSSNNCNNVKTSENNGNKKPDNETTSKRSSINYHSKTTSDKDPGRQSSQISQNLGTSISHDSHVTNGSRHGSSSSTSNSKPPTDKEEKDEYHRDHHNHRQHRHESSSGSSRRHSSSSRGHHESSSHHSSSHRRSKDRESRDYRSGSSRRSNHISDRRSSENSRSERTDSSRRKNSSASSNGTSRSSSVIKKEEVIDDLNKQLRQGKVNEDEHQMKIDDDSCSHASTLSTMSTSSSTSTVLKNNNTTNRNLSRKDQNNNKSSDVTKSQQSSSSTSSVKSKENGYAHTNGSSAKPLSNDRMLRIFEKINQIFESKQYDLLAKICTIVLPFSFTDSSAFKFDLFSLELNAIEKLEDLLLPEIGSNNSKPSHNNIPNNNNNNNSTGQKSISKSTHGNNNSSISKNGNVSSGYAIKSGSRTQAQNSFSSNSTNANSSNHNLNNHNANNSNSSGGGCQSFQKPKEIKTNIIK